MLRSFNQIRGYAIHASDGAIGSLHDLYFDDQSTLIRYFVVDTGTWLPGRRVLVAPAAIGGVDAERAELVTGLTRQQVEDSPSIHTDRPVSRQAETELHTHYGWQPYWTVPPMAGALAPYWGLAAPGTVQPRPKEARIAEEVAAREREQADPHLRSAREVEGYHVAASDGEIGHVEDFLIDDDTWAIQLIGIDTRNWLPGRTVVISPSWLRAIDWNRERIEVDLTRRQIEDSPEYDTAIGPDQGYLERLAEHYGRPWHREGPTTRM
ncbi:MAG TPA: PRC-barrel domain-containing protein [Geminicoccaceae bacterium]|nr:PRC-barrel domain-containing protein [Geminicoccaceae bacterium]